MATEKEIKQAWERLPKGISQPDAIVRFYRMAENAGEKECLSGMEKKMLSDSTLKAALQTFGWATRSKLGVITLKAVIREVLLIATEKAEKS